MGTLLSLLTVASFIAIFYFWLKKHDKKWIIISIIATIGFGSLITLTPEYKQQQIKEVQERKERKAKEEKQKLAAKKEKQEQEKKQKQAAKIEKQNKLAAEKKKKLAEKKKKEEQQKKRATKKAEEKKLAAKRKKENQLAAQKKKKSSTKASRSTLLKRAKKLKYGMSLKEVKKIMKDKPKEEKDEVGNMTLMYGNYVVYLGFDKNNKLVTAMNGAPQIAKQGRKAASKKKQRNKNYTNKLIGFAQAFGTKPSEEIQRMPSVYKTVEYDNDLYIIWNPGNNLPLLLRVDDTVNNVTKVYEYDKNNTENNYQGKLLYTGRTIIQKNKRPNIYY